MIARHVFANQFEINETYEHLYTASDEMIFSDNLHQKHHCLNVHLFRICQCLRWLLYHMWTFVILTWIQKWMSEIPQCLCEWMWMCVCVPELQRATIVNTERMADNEWIFESCPWNIAIVFAVTNTAPELTCHRIGMFMDWPLFLRRSKWWFKTLFFYIIAARA